MFDRSNIGSTEEAYLWNAEIELYKIGMRLVCGFHCKKIRKLSLKSKMMLVASLFASAQWIFNPTKILISIWFSQWVMGTFPALSPFAPSEE